ncbi:MAG: ABC transporter permease subunit, partial [Devosia sp.]
IGLIYLGLPFSVLLLYPSLSRLDRHLPEAARTMGATPIRTFFTIIVPLTRNGALASFVMLFVFDLGSYVLPQILGKPEHWTVSVLIADQALFQSNIPLAAALAVVLALLATGVVVFVFAAGRQRRPS